MQYNPELFLQKNKDTITTDMEEAVASSTLPLAEKLFGAQDSGSSSSSSVSTVGGRFKRDLDSLTSKLRSTAPHYVRCIKSNSAKAAGQFESKLVQEQLRYSGVFEAVVIQQVML